jgi:hypothetical protein
LDILWKVGRTALHSDTDLFSWDDPLGVVEAIEDSSMDIFDDTRELDRVTRTAEIGAALVPGTDGKKGPIGGKYAEPKPMLLT